METENSKAKLLKYQKADYPEFLHYAVDKIEELTEERFIQLQDSSDDARWRDDQYLLRMFNHTTDPIILYEAARRTVVRDLLGSRQSVQDSQEDARHIFDMLCVVKFDTSTYGSAPGLGNLDVNRFYRVAYMRRTTKAAASSTEVLLGIAQRVKDEQAASTDILSHITGVIDTLMTRDYQDIPERFQRAHGRGLIKAVERLVQKRSNQPLITSLSQNLSKYAFVMREAEFGIDGLDNLERLSGRIDKQLERIAIGKKPEKSEAELATNVCIRLIAETLACADEAGGTYGKVLYGQLDKNKKNVADSSIAKTLTLSTIINLANSLLPQMNARITGDNGGVFEGLQVSIKSIPEAFRRLMWVAYGGKEVSLVEGDLDLGTRFQIVDDLASLMDYFENPHKPVVNKVGNTAMHGSRIPKGQAYWGKWKRGWGILT
jgi:hypothetical protein